MATIVNASQVRAKIAQVRAQIPGTFDSATLGPAIVRRTKDRFTTKTDPEGNRWKPRSSKTRSGGSLLLREGNLRDAIAVIQSRPQGIYASNTGLGFRIGIESRKVTETFKTTSRTSDTAVYGRAHQLGDSYVPKRRFIGLSKEDREYVLARIRRNLRKAVI